MKDSVRFVLNGEEQNASGIETDMTLLAYLRGIGLTGTKEACAEGECGACAVNLRVPGPGGRSRYVTINSCLTLAVEVAGREVWTVEGLARDGELHPVQRAMIEAGGSQCGYCTPGFVMSLHAFYYDDPRPPVGVALSGNLCRCTGYRPIVEAAEALPEPAADDPFWRESSGLAEASEPVAYEAHGVRYERPRSLEEVLALRARFPRSTVLAGGTDLVVGLNHDGERPEHWISLSGVLELERIETESDRIRIGAGVTWERLELELRDRVPILAELLERFASPLIRARGTLGGNLMTASPVGDGAPVLLALDAQVVLRSMKGERSVPLAEFFTGYRQTQAEPGELLTEIQIPTKAPDVSRFYKVSKRELDDISGVSAGFGLWIEDGIIHQARLAYGGVAATPVRAESAERVLEGRAPDADALAAALSELEGAFTPIDDVRASAAYRTAMICSLFRKFWSEELA